MKGNLLKDIDNNAKIISSMAKEIWENPETAYNEVFANETTKNVLQDNGFKIVEIEDMPTAYYAEIGIGKPIIGLLGEYDALPGLSQEVSTSKSPLVPGDPGHGCGHNVMFVAVVGAGLSLKKLVEDGTLKGTIRLYACPAEETLAGKTLMHKKGAFDDLDLALGWHPLNFTGVYANITNAMMSVEFNFTGTPAHAGAQPELGRSALDAVGIMNVATEYLREHVIRESRIHYVITNGGQTPNLVPGEASVLYYIRAENKEQVYSIFDRIKKCAQGAALATETSVEYEIKADCYNTVSNHVLENLLDKNINEIGDVPFTEKEYSYAKELIETVPEEWYKNDLNLYGLDDSVILNDSSVGICGRGLIGGASTDSGDVSHLVPLAIFAVAGLPIGIPLHSWQAVSSFGSSIADVIVVHAAKILAATTYDLLTDGDKIIEDAKKEFSGNPNIGPYKTLL